MIRVTIFFNGATAGRFYYKGTEEQCKEDLKVIYTEPEYGWTIH